MHLSDLRIRAMDGSVFVDGRLAIESDEPAAATLPSQDGRLIGVNLRHRGFGHASFHLYGEARRAPDGFWGAGPPVMTVNFEEGVPDLQALLARMYSGAGRLQTRVSDLRLAMLSVRYPLPNGAWRELYGHLQALDLTLTKQDDGLRISFEGPIGPMAFPDEPPIFSRARLVGDFVVPKDYWRIRGLTGAMWSSGSAERLGGWRAWNDGLGATALGEYAQLYCAGRLDWGEGGDVLSPTGPFVEARLSEHQLMLRPAGELDLLGNGFAAPRRYSGSAPELMLFFGHADWARMLESGDEAAFEWRGPGAGHLDGLTGRDAYEEGFRRQPLRSLQLQLIRDRSGVTLVGRGELNPLNGEGPSLGPRVEFDLQIPRGYFLMRGLDLGKFWTEWKQDFPSPTTW